MIKLMSKIQNGIYRLSKSSQNLFQEKKRLLYALKKAFQKQGTKTF
jgi:hypothetical protein